MHQSDPISEDPPRHVLLLQVGGMGQRDVRLARVRLPEAFCQARVARDHLVVVPQRLNLLVVPEEGPSVLGIGQESLERLRVRCHELLHDRVGDNLRYELVAVLKLLPATRDLLSLPGIVSLPKAVLPPLADLVEGDLLAVEVDEGSVLFFLFRLVGLVLGWTFCFLPFTGLRLRLRIFCRLRLVVVFRLLVGVVGVRGGLLGLVLCCRLRGGGLF